MNDELSRLIAESVDPSGGNWHAASDWMPKTSAWRWCDGIWVPTDCTDPAMTLVLLEKEKLEVWWRDANTVVVGQAVMNGTVRMLANSAAAATIGEAAAMSFAKVRGLLK